MRRKKEVLMESKRWKKMQKDDKNIELFGERDKTEGLVYKKI